MTSGSWWLFGIGFSLAWIAVGFCAADMLDWLRQVRRQRSARRVARIQRYFA